MELDDCAEQTLDGFWPQNRDAAKRGRVPCGGLVDEYVADRVARGRWRPASAYVNGKLLHQFADDFDGVEVDQAAVERWIQGGDLSAHYRRRRWSVVRGFLKWAGVDIEAEAPPVPGAVPRPLRDVDVRALLDACDVRDRVIVSLGICEGLRRGEMCRVELADIDLDGRVMFVQGKGGRQRWVPITDATARRVVRYIQEERGWAAGPLLQSRRLGGGLRPATIGERVRKIMRDAGIYGPGVTLHALRHTAATALWMSSGSDLFMVQQLLGHASVRTTAMYVKSRPTDEMREAMNAASR